MRPQPPSQLLPHSQLAVQPVSQPSLIEPQHSRPPSPSEPPPLDVGVSAANALAGLDASHSPLNGGHDAGQMSWLSSPEG